MRRRTSLLAGPRLTADAVAYHRERLSLAIVPDGPLEPLRLDAAGVAGG